MSYPARRTRTSPLYFGLLSYENMRAIHAQRRSGDIAMRRLHTRMLARSLLVATLLVLGCGLAGSQTRPQGQKAPSQKGHEALRKVIQSARKNLSSAYVLGDLIRYECILVRAIACASGYGAAVEEAEKLRESAEQARPESKEELAALDKLIAEMKDARAGSPQAASEQREIIRKNYEEIIHKSPGTDKAAEAALQIARLTEEYGGRQEALTAYRQVVKEYTKSTVDFKARGAVARIYERSGERENAKGVWARAALAFAHKDHGRSAVARLKKLYAEDKEYTTGAKVLSDLARACPHIPSQTAAEAMLAAGQLLERQEEFDGALAAYREAIRREPSENSIQGVRAIKNMCVAGNKPEQAIRELVKIVTLYPNTEAAARAELYMGEVYQSQGKLDLAEKAFLAVIRKCYSSKERKKAAFKLTAIFYARADVCRAKMDRLGELAALRAAYPLDPDEAKKGVRLLRTVSILTSLGRYSDAQACLRSILNNPSDELDPLREAAQYKEAQIYCRSGDRKTALQLLKNIVSTCQSGSVRDKAERLTKEIELEAAASTNR